VVISMTSSSLLKMDFAYITCCIFNIGVFPGFSFERFHSKNHIKSSPLVFVGVALVVLFPTKLVSSHLDFPISSYLLFKFGFKRKKNIFSAGTTARATGLTTAHLAQLPVTPLAS
jgi:hypothetical protein